MKTLTLALTLSISLLTSAFGSDLTSIPDLLPTTYYTAQEANTSCKGKFRNVQYNGSEISFVKTRKEEIIAKVCTRFYKVLLMEGSGILKDRGHGPISVNWAGKSRFKVQRRCILGHGISEMDCLLPYHTIAADLKKHKLGDVIYIPDAKGIKLLDGSIHNGFFIVLDTGGAFIGVGQQRVDLFVGLQDDSNNLFKDRGFHHKKPIKAFKVTGQARAEALRMLKEKFGDMLSDRHE